MCGGVSSLTPDVTHMHQHHVLPQNHLLVKSQLKKETDLKHLEETE